ncbi:TIGR02594 family protein [Burkholderia gladioli]|uniref:NlpC/P60 family protein n=1 Tax=Burkholderia gladioli TaxID=28095 RepID=UPI001641FAEE|nr:TIGR02594 family protein [Burkholderia gladioli]
MKPERHRIDAATPPWMPVAFAEAGIARYGAGRSNPRIVEYNGATNLAGYDDKISWCSSFANWCMTRAGLAGTGSALARSWLDWGRELAEPVYGCIAVLMRDDPNSWKGHVGFYLRHEDDSIVLFGGNQLDEVRELAYPRAELLAYRWPHEMQGR